MNHEIRQRFARIRKKRLGSLTAFNGECGTLADELEREKPAQRFGTYPETTDDELTGAIRLLGRIRGAVTIIHRPPGCGAAKLEDELRSGSGPWLLTNIEESDSILGADGKLRDAIGRARRLWKPDIIFILSTPVAAINNNDIQSAAVEAEGLYGIPVVPIFAAGLRFKSPLYGFDLVFHALAKHVLNAWPIPEKGGRFINLIGTAETRTGNIIRELTAAGLSYNNVSGYYALSDLSRSPGAIASAALDGDEAGYLLAWLEESRGVARLDVPPPIGLTGTHRWLLAVADALDADAETRNRIEAARAETAETLAVQRLKDLSVFIDLPPEQAFGIGELVSELGGKVTTFALTHADRTHASRLREWSRRNNPRVLIEPGQPFEKINALSKWRPDLYIGRSETAVWAAAAGIPAASVDAVDIYGFQGALALAGLFGKALRNSALSRYLNAGGASYREGWFAKSVNWHFKQEVR
ncbi:hypothetical protein KIH86_22330 [Paenibacillus sp. HN-1]|uniref:nitrogenase component 1 n=1 Tax=Paenibacillus TaxID=44249 RepID=UPI001CA811CD|nr:MULTISPECIES: nitrogenase component 1 [Paenibacillus]MBY9079155.1 hypothetical protein [Paenibacillus sp. CGMCC 1.18879]MBY9086933.1 hypothetical protein [Paenibacillus sinensis]